MIHIIILSSWACSHLGAIRPKVGKAPPPPALSSWMGHNYSPHGRRCSEASLLERCYFSSSSSWLGAEHTMTALNEVQVWTAATSTSNRLVVLYFILSARSKNPRRMQYAFGYAIQPSVRLCSSTFISRDSNHSISRVPTVRESQGILRESGKVRENREGQEKSGNFKILLTRPIIYALFSQFLSASGVCPRPSPGLRPCKHCRLVYIAIFYNGTKFSITFVYLVLFYWCCEYRN